MIYVYNVLVVKGRDSWQVVKVWSDGDREPVSWHSFRWQALRSARSLARRLADWQGPNLRLEINAERRDGTFQHEIYGKDPRTA